MARRKKDENSGEDIFSVKHINCGTKVYVREKPEGEILCIIPDKTKVIIEEEADGWSRVVGYIKSELLK